MKKKIKCPQCQSPVEWTEKNLFRQFCSQRCQLIDLGAWASEKNKIAGSTLFDSEEDLEKLTKH